MIGFPNPVNEKAARVVAFGVVLMALTAIVFELEWLLPLIALGFLARVLTGPKLSPLGQLATKVVAPRLGDPKYVPGPPKRFAQAMGLTMSTAAVLLYFAFDAHTAAWVVTGVLAAAATLESVFALCLGCQVFAVLMRIGLVPEATCERCADIWAPAR
jgi:Domain of unknown function (DUF4395)